MKLPVALALLASCTLAASQVVQTEPPGEPGQVFVLQDYRWVPVLVRRTPTSIDCSFQVVKGYPTVHAELVSDRDFLLFSRHREYDSLAVTQTGSAGGFHRMIETPGRYRVLVVNTSGAPPAAVSLVVRADADPSPVSISTGVSPRRRLVVILSSLTVFFATVLWSGRRLLRAWRNKTV